MFFLLFYSFVCLQQQKGVHVTDLTFRDYVNQLKTCQEDKNVTVIVLGIEQYFRYVVSIFSNTMLLHFYIVIIIMHIICVSLNIDLLTLTLFAFWECLFHITWTYLRYVIQNKIGLWSTVTNALGNNSYYT